MKRVLVLAVCLTLAGCATIVKTPRSGPYRGVVESRLTQLAEQNTWLLEGRLAIRKGDEGFSAGIRWQQKDEDFDIRLLDPLGRRVAWLVGNPRRVSLTTVDGKTYKGVDPQLLLKQNLGWAIPLDSLKYWVKGMPDPHKVSWREEYDDIGRPLLLDQADWHVKLSRYDSDQPLALPKMVRLEREGFRAKLLIDSRSLSENRE
ncbi:MAG TPA: outer membrane lipoprotein LolB [Chromatiales bacterium]|nr:outer membrane lipoprotein LolB [Thiotrichales bacterium]HIP69148.1 outer membrane lipoprotein LolB [Chromatiales bacterium]